MIPTGTIGVKRVFDLCEMFLIHVHVYNITSTKNVEGKN